MNEQEFQERYYEFQMMAQQIEQLEQHIIRVKQHVSELEKVKKSIEELKGKKQGDELLINLGAGIFAKGKVEDGSNIMINVGSSTVIEKDSDSAIDLIKKQLIEMRQSAAEIEAEIMKLSQNQAALQEELIKSQNAKS